MPKEQMYPGYVYKATKDSDDGKIKRDDLLTVSRDGYVTIQKRDYEFMSPSEMSVCDVEYIKTDAYRIALTWTGEHVIAKDDNAR